MFQTQTINQSRTFGVNLLKNMEEVNSLKFCTVQEAPFIVLKSPNIPSLLIETGYLSNPDEEQLLCKGSYQKAVAEAITRSILQSLPLPWETAYAAGAASGEQASTPQIADQRTSDLPPERISAVLPSFVGPQHCRCLAASQRLRHGQTLYAL